MAVGSHGGGVGAGAEAEAERLDGRRVEVGLIVLLIVGNNCTLRRGSGGTRMGWRWRRRRWWMCGRVCRRLEKRHLGGKIGPGRIRWTVCYFPLRRGDVRLPFRIAGHVVSGSGPPSPRHCRSCVSAGCCCCCCCCCASSSSLPFFEVQGLGGSDLVRGLRCSFHKAAAGCEWKVY